MLVQTRIEMSTVAFELRELSHKKKQLKTKLILGQNVISKLLV